MKAILALPLTMASFRVSETQCTQTHIDTVVPQIYRYSTMESVKNNVNPIGGVPTDSIAEYIDGSKLSEYLLSLFNETKLAWNEKQNRHINVLHEFVNDLVENSQKVDPEIQKVINENFFDLLVRL